MNLTKGLKRARGVFYTQGNPFKLRPFVTWAKEIELDRHVVLEPFAGANNIIKALNQSGFANRSKSFDIMPGDVGVTKRDTLQKFPHNYQVIVTNPPWLAKNSAHRRALFYPETGYDDLYKHCLALCLRNAPFVAALVPATFLQSGLFRDRLHSLVFLHAHYPFVDTDNPAVLALFVPWSGQGKIYHDNQFIGKIAQLERYLPRPSPEIGNKRLVRFNAPRGHLGFIAIDNTRHDTITFCPGAQLAKYKIKNSSRMITRIEIKNSRLAQDYIERLNRAIEQFREHTHDIFLTPFKGIRRDGKYRRRMDFALARKFMELHL